uniref:Uncharacterized protein n=1 Tax=Pipistrellus kuhlii TaxID=59472 RepID=A0A7J8A7N2_PIPKU|nr:hypothetical protein mPipKuh1_008875 [Pipistrellus kuhlii]
MPIQLWKHSISHICPSTKKTLKCSVHQEHSLKKVKQNSAFFIKLDKNGISSCTVTRHIIKNAHTSLGISSTFSFLCLVCLGISVFCRVVPILASISFPFSPLGTFSPFFAGAFLGLGSGFGGAGLVDTMADFLSGSSFTLALSPLASPSAFLLAMRSKVTMADHRCWMQGCRGARAVIILALFLPLVYSVPGD